MQRTPCYIWRAGNFALYHRVETWSTHVAEIVCQPMACQNVFFSAVVGRDVGGRDMQLLKHIVEWSDAKGTICCLAIKHHPHKDWAVANVKEIKATANHQQKWWSTLHDPRCTSQQPTQAGFILLTSPASLQCWHCTGTSISQHGPIYQPCNHWMENFKLKNKEDVRGYSCNYWLIDVVTDGVKVFSDALKFEKVKMIFLKYPI